MASNGVKEPLLSGITDATAQTHRKDAPKRRMFHHSRSAPPADHISQDTAGLASVPRSDSIFGNLHPNFRKMAIFFFAYLGIGAVCFYLVRRQIKGKKTDGFLDAVYLCIVTMTTVGYGDLVPNNTVSKLLACAFVFTGMALGALILGKAADYLVEKQEILLVRAMHMHQNVHKSEILKEAETHRIRYKCISVFILILVLIVVGTTFLVIVEKFDVVDAFYCVCSTITTLGYGDKSFSTKAGRIFAVFWILTSTICLAQFFLYIAELNTEKRQRALVKWVLTRRVTNLDLEAADLDDDGRVGYVKFLFYW